MRNDQGHEDLPEVNATFFGGITQFGNVLDYAKYLADTTDDNENTFKMFAAQLYALGHINSYKNLHMRRAIIFFGVAILSELIIIMLMTWGQHGQPFSDKCLNPILFFQQIQRF